MQANSNNRFNQADSDASQSAVGRIVWFLDWKFNFLRKNVSVYFQNNYQIPLTQISFLIGHANFISFGSRY